MKNITIISVILIAACIFGVCGNMNAESNSVVFTVHAQAQENTLPATGEMLMGEFTADIERISGVPLYVDTECTEPTHPIDATEPEELAPPIEATEPDILLPAVPELAPPIVHECMPACVRYEPTCTKAGYYESVCGECGYFYHKDYPATGHAWSDWSVVMNDDTTSVVRICSNCGEQETKISMERLNTIAIPSIEVNDVFQDTTTPSIVDSGLMYSEPIGAAHPTITGNLRLSSVACGDAIYLNTANGLTEYIVVRSEPATLYGEQLIGDNTGDDLWKNENAALHLYTIDGDTGWIVIAE